MNRKSLFTELRAFLLLWGSQTVSELGTAMTNFALVIWVYSQKGSASSLTLLTLCSFLPTIFFRFIAGTAADRWNKKHIMLLADSLAACGTAVVFLLYSMSALRVWHLYVVNILLSFMNAFQAPAAYVVTSLLVPKEHYAKVSGLQSFSGSAVTILAPALGSTLLAFGGMEAVLTLDLITFAVAFFTLLFLVELPAFERKPKEERAPFLKDCLTGLRYLREHLPLLHMILFFSLINFLAKLGDDGMISPFVLSRTGNDQAALGMVQSAVALGILVGSLFVMATKPPKKKTRVIFLFCGITCFGNVLLSLTRTVPAWCAIVFVTYATAAIMNAHLTAIMRTHVPIDMQGRVFSAKDTVQNCTIPLGLLLGGILADHVFEPFMAKNSNAQQALAAVFGEGLGSGIAVIFFIVGILGTLISLSRLRKPIYHVFDEDKETLC